jgi:hypothetical protein
MEYTTNPFREILFVFLDIRKVRVDKLFLAGPICYGYQIVDRLNAMVIREASVLGRDGRFRFSIIRDDYRNSLLTDCTKIKTSRHLELVIDR